MAETKEPGSNNGRFKEILTDFADNTSCHGIGSIGRSTSTFFRILWTLIVATFMIIMVVQLSQLVKKYYSYPKSTSIEVGTGVLDFPSVTVCNVNSMRKSVIANSTEPEYQELRRLYLKAVEYHSSLEGDKQGDFSFEPTVDESGGDYDNNGDYDDDNGDDTMADGWADYSEEQIEHHGEEDKEYEFRKRFDKESAKLLSDDFLIIGHRKEILIQKCVFMGKACSFQNFTTFFHSKYGLCHTFNSNEYYRDGGRREPLQVKRSGRDYGLNLILNIEYQDYMPIKTSGYGARLVIHDFGTFASPLGHGISIPAGFTTSIAVTQKRIIRLSEPYGTCENGTDMYSVYEKKYTQMACERFCRHTYIFKICKCYQEGFREYYPRAEFLEQRLDSCSLSDSSLDCLKRVEDMFRADDDEIDCECEQACQENHFLQTLSVHQWPERIYRKVVARQACKVAKAQGREDMCTTLNQMNPKEMRNNFVSLRVYYKDLNFESITQEPAYLIPSFLADIGGTLGLWAGISILTGAEVVVLIIAICRFICSKITCCKKSSKAKDESSKDGELTDAMVSSKEDKENEVDV